MDADREDKTIFLNEFKDAEVFAVRLASANVSLDDGIFILASEIT